MWSSSLGMSGHRRCLPTGPAGQAQRAVSLQVPAHVQNTRPTFQQPYSTGVRARQKLAAARAADGAGVSEDGQPAETGGDERA